MGEKRFTINKELQLIVCVTGIYLFYLLFGIFQENITSQRFGPQGERFNYTSFLLMIQSIVNAFCAILVITALGLPRDKTPIHKYCWISVTSISAMFCSNKALMFVDYPTQVLAKSCKPIPVMVMGLLVFKKRYSLAKYLCVTMVTAGIALFMMPSSHKEGVTTTLLGIVLLFLSLAFDGVTGPFQDDLISKYKPTSPHMMYYSNLWATLVMFLVAFVGNDLLPAIDFCLRYPEIIPQIVLFSITSALGQNFIYYTVHQFGALTCTTVTTTRKFFTILASVLWFGHALSSLQWFAVVLVFSGLGLDIASSYMKTAKSA
jgi:UDP-galactose transporter B1